jgi:hypothetical protein
MKKFFVLFAFIAPLGGVMAEARPFDANFLDKMQQTSKQGFDRPGIQASQKLLDLSSENPHAWSISAFTEENQEKTLYSEIRPRSGSAFISPQRKFISETTIRKTYVKTAVVPFTFRPEPYFDMVNRENFGRQGQDMEFMREKNKRAMVKALRYQMVFGQE